jgi:hypothetical protein
MEPYTYRGDYDRVHFISQCKQPNNFCYALVCSNDEKSCNGDKNMPLTIEAERLMHQDTREVTTRPPSDCVLIVRFCQGNL